MISVPADFKAALKAGLFTRSSYTFLMAEGQTRANASWKWTDAPEDPPSIFSGISFSRQSPVLQYSAPEGQSLAGRDLSSLRLADPDRRMRSWFELNGFRDYVSTADGVRTATKRSVRWEFWWDYVYGAGLHQPLQMGAGVVRSINSGVDANDNIFLDVKIGGPFAQMDPDLAFSLTGEQQKARRNPADTSLDELERSWEIKLGRPI